MPNPNTHQSVPDRLFYESSNGNVWYLSEDPATGLLAIKHVANAQAGGHISFLDVESFIRSGNGPEHQAFRGSQTRHL